MITEKKSFLFILPLCFFSFSFLFYFLNFSWEGITFSFVSILFLVFVTLSGFFLNIQIGRHKSISKSVADFDGEILFLYRTMKFFGPEYQEKLRKILQKHYESKNWKKNLWHKNETLKNITDIVFEILESKKIPKDKKAIVPTLLNSVSHMQKKRKSLVSLANSTIPNTHWYILDFLAAIVIISIDFLPNENILIILIQGALSTIIVAVLLIIRRINNLALFGNIVGESTAKDTLKLLAKK